MIENCGNALDCVNNAWRRNRETGFVLWLRVFGSHSRICMLRNHGRTSFCEAVARVARPPIRSPKIFWVTAPDDDDETTNSSVHLVIDYDTIALLVVLLHYCFNHLHKRIKGQERYKKYPRVIDCGLLHLFQFEKDISQHFTVI